MDVGRGSSGILSTTFDQLVFSLSDTTLVERVACLLVTKCASLNLNRFSQCWPGEALDCTLLEGELPDRKSVV